MGITASPWMSCVPPFVSQSVFTAVPLHKAWHIPLDRPHGLYDMIIEISLLHLAEYCYIQLYNVMLLFVYTVLLY